MRGKTKTYRFGMGLIVAVLVVGISGLGLSPALAANVASFSDVLSTIKESVVANHTLTFTIQDAWNASETLTLDFPAGFSNAGFANTEAEDYDITDDGAEKAIVASGSCAANSIEITTVDTVDPVGFTFTYCAGSTAIAASSIIVIEIGTNATNGAAGNDQITNQTAAQNNTNGKITLTGGGGFTDTGSLALEIVADNDVTVNATVDPSITCAFTGLTTTFSSLTTGAVSTSDTQTTVTVSSNAGNGVNIIVYDAGNATNPGLYKSAATTYLIGSADGAFGNIATLAAGTDGFGISGASSAGSGAALTVDGRFDASGGANEMGGLEVGAGAAVSIAASTGALASRVLTVTHKAAVSGLAPAGSYTDTITYVCTGIY
ncbi:MAG: hypothetical protein HZB70_04060 [Candidatus Berkelbacteria bacterium]|nr:MAG: hypothetical protein HZB70_04060 [Candidatus Berkelbacteria bacterium]QQG51525.1 MAG: hypothetical protein HY845_03130 [Candidatus Berkelbacteria bacterium]